MSRKKHAVIFERNPDTEQIRVRGFGEEESIDIELGDHKPLLSYIEWMELKECAKSNKSLREALDHAILLFNLIRDNDE